MTSFRHYEEDLRYLLGIVIVVFSVGFSLCVAFFGGFFATCFLASFAALRCPSHSSTSCSPDWCFPPLLRFNLTLDILALQQQLHRVHNSHKLQRHLDCKISQPTKLTCSSSSNIRFFLFRPTSFSFNWIISCTTLDSFWPICVSFALLEGDNANVLILQ